MSSFFEHCPGEALILNTLVAHGYKPYIYQHPLFSAVAKCVICGFVFPTSCVIDVDKIIRTSVRTESEAKWIVVQCAVPLGERKNFKFDHIIIG